MHILTGKEVFAHRAGSGTGVTEEVGARQSKPLFQSSRVKARADGGVEQHLACTQLGKLVFAQQQHILYPRVAL